jgi:hypothetical protein
VNAVRQKIEIFKPFGEAYELMEKILFRPFDISKWFIIGFAAFLAGNFGSGFGFSWPGRFDVSHAFRHRQAPTIPHLEPWGVILFVIGFFVIVAVVVLLAWLSARGRFMFTDCIVRNRAAIAEPWREYREEGNSYFLFVMAVAVGAIVLIIVLALSVFLPLNLIGRTSHGVTTPLLAVLLVPFFVVWISFAIFFGLVSYFMVPVMYIRRCGAMEAFRNVSTLVLHNVGPFILFCLFSIVLFIALALIGAIVTCLTCCIAALPYLGTVILLPLFVWLRAFEFCFLRQFGPGYDVWGGVRPPESPTTTPMPPPLPR